MDYTTLLEMMKDLLRGNDFHNSHPEMLQIVSEELMYEIDIETAMVYSILHFVV